jgi:hypothetical protein
MRCRDCGTPVQDTDTVVGTVSRVVHGSVCMDTRCRASLGVLEDLRPGTE